MQIPTAQQFGNQVSDIPQGTFAGSSSTAAGMVSAGNALQQVGNEIQQQRVDLARAKAANALTDHQIKVTSTVDNIKTQVESGQLPWDQAEGVYKDAVSKIPVAKIDNLDQVGKLSYQKGLQQTAFKGSLEAKKIADTGQRVDFKDQFVAGLDNLGKLAGMPNADIESINAQADTWKPMAAKAGIPANIVDKSIQDFKDQNWMNQAQLRAMQSRDSLPALQQMEHDLTSTDGFYVNRLDSNKRNAVLSQVITHRMQLENRLATQADRRETAAEQEVGKIQNNISSGVPIPAEMWNESAKVLQGTQQEPTLRTLQAQEVQVQNMLRQPVAAQLKFVQDATAKLDTEGGDPKDRANLKLMAETVQRNMQTMQKTPLLFIQNRTGQDIPPLDLSKLFNGDPDSVQQIANRMNTLKTAQKHYGSDITLRPLLPQESQMLTGLLDKSSAKDQSQIFAGLYNALGDAQAYQGAMQQIAPDAPVKAIAGMLAAKEKTIPLEKHWFSPNVIGHSGDVSATMLQGLQLLSPTKGEAGQDGKPKVGLYLPSDNTLQADFQSTIGTAFAGRPSAAENAFQAVKAYYVGRAAQTGRVAASNQDIDSKLVKESIRATLGDVVNYNGKGEVLAPWGMDSSTFDDKVHAALIAEGTKRGFTAEASSAMRNVGLRNLGDGTYYVTQGKNFVMDPKGHPLIIDVNQ